MEKFGLGTIAKAPFVTAMTILPFAMPLVIVGMIFGPMIAMGFFTPEKLVKSRKELYAEQAPMFFGCAFAIDGLEPKESMIIEPHSHSTLNGLAMSERMVAWPWLEIELEETSTLHKVSHLTK